MREQAFSRYLKRLELLTDRQREAAHQALRRNYIRAAVTMVCLATAVMIAAAPVID